MLAIPKAAEPKKVYFYFPSSVHSVDEYKMKNLPEGFCGEGTGYAANPLAKSTRDKKSLKGRISSFIYPTVSDLYNHAAIALRRPKKRAFRSDGFDLVHSAQTLLDTNLPYVLDMEHPSVFCGYNQYGLDSRPFAAALTKELGSERLKKIMPMSNAAKRALLNFISSDAVEEKTETVYPVAMPPGKKPEKSGVFSFLFVGKVFYEKGGYETLLAFEKISKEHEAVLNFLGPVPEPLKGRYSKNPRIRFYENLPYGQVRGLFSSSHCLVFPSKYDTLGFVVLEAFAFGLPAITIDSFALPELVGDGKRGLVIEPPFHAFREDGGYAWPDIRTMVRERLRLSANPPPKYISSLAEAMERMLLDTKMRRRLSRNAHSEAAKGIFSVRAYKEKIKRIYNEALS